MVKSSVESDQNTRKSWEFNSYLQRVYVGTVIHFQNIYVSPDYVYEGEVKILQEDLDKFLAIANRLQLNGLIGGETTEDEQQFEDKQEIECPQPSQIQVQDLPNANLKKNPAVKKQQTIEKRIVAVNENYELQLKQAFDENVETLSNGSLSCKICGKVTTGTCRTGNMKIHLEVHIEGLSFDCKYCDKTFRSFPTFKCS